MNDRQLHDCLISFLITFVTFCHISESYKPTQNYDVGFCLMNSLEGKILLLIFATLKRIFSNYGKKSNDFVFNADDGVIYEFSKCF